MGYAEPARAAIVYDFDGTLAPGNMQEHSFIPSLDLTPEAFWGKVKATARTEDADEILVYMREMMLLARARGAPITREMLEQHGRVPLFDGLDRWFERVASYAHEHNLTVEHYVISSGLLEMIRGCAIHSRFTKVFASRFIYDERGRAAWPGVAINYTTKTQFLFRINKGINNTWDSDRINRWVPMEERPLPFSRMIFIGDGATDIPSMKTVRSQGGHSIAVFDPRRWDSAPARELVFRLISEDRAHFVAPADYTEGSQLDVTVRGILGRIARDAGFRDEGER
jgi:phosphoserine phosphatase